MAHLRQIDGTQHTVIMMQLENEPGALARCATSPHGAEAV